MSGCEIEISSSGSSAINSTNECGDISSSPSSGAPRCGDIVCSKQQSCVVFSQKTGVSNVSCQWLLVCLRQSGADGTYSINTMVRVWSILPTNSKVKAGSTSHSFCTADNSLTETEQYENGRCRKGVKASIKLGCTPGISDGTGRCLGFSMVTRHCSLLGYCQDATFGSLSDTSFRSKESLSYMIAIAVTT